MTNVIYEEDFFYPEIEFWGDDGVWPLIPMGMGYVTFLYYSGHGLLFYKLSCCISEYVVELIVWLMSPDWHGLRSIQTEAVAGGNELRKQENNYRALLNLQLCQSASFNCISANEDICRKDIKTKISYLTQPYIPEPLPKFEKKDALVECLSVLTSLFTLSVDISSPVGIIQTMASITVICNLVRFFPMITFQLITWGGFLNLLGTSIMFNRTRRVVKLFISFLPWPVQMSLMFGLCCSIILNNYYVFMNAFSSSEEFLSVGL